MTPAPPSAWILAGGAAIRYGSDKALARIGSETLLERTARICGECGLGVTVVARFARTMGTLLASGVPILDSMEIVAKTAGNVVVHDGIMFVRARVSEGKDLATPLMETGLMPPMVVQMISVGEQTGALDAMLSKLADFYEEEVDVAVASMTRMLEPLLMVFLGGVIGGLVIAMYMPIFEMAGNIKAG